MAVYELRETDLTAFEHAVAGHDGVLTDPTGELVIKPCTDAESSFYEASFANHEEFALLLPKFMGTITLSTPAQRAALQNRDPMSIGASLQAQEGDATKSLSRSNDASMFGAQLDTGRAIVLENLAAGFVKPSIMDIKLGVQLWHPETPITKQNRLNKVASETTSSSLGFRIAGMRLWERGFNGTAGQYRVFDKMYGRNFSSDNVSRGFEEFFGAQTGTSQQLTSNKRVCLELCAAEIAHVQKVIADEESRMFSASILLVIESDDVALQQKLEELEKAQRNEESRSPDVDSVEDESLPKILSVKLIDFAHAAWTPGQGPDGNALVGVRSICDILERLLAQHQDCRPGPANNVGEDNATTT